MLLIHPGSARTRQATVTVPLDVLADHRGETIVEFCEEGNVRVLVNKKNAARIQSYVTDVISAFDGVEPAQTEPSVSVTPQTGWNRLIATERPTLFDGKPPALALQTGTSTIPLSPVLSAAGGNRQTAWCYLSDEPIPDGLDLSGAPITLSIDGSALATVSLTRQDTLLQMSTGQLLLPLDPDYHTLFVLTPQENHQVAAPVLTDANGRAQATYAIALSAPAGNSLDLLFAPFAAEGVSVTGLEYEGFFARVVSDPLTGWNPAQLPSLSIRSDLALTLTAARTKTDDAGTPCIRVAYDPFTAYGRIWRADAVRITENGTATAVQKNGFLYFPLAEDEPYTEDQPIITIITLDFLSLEPTILVFE